MKEQRETLNGGVIASVFGEPHARSTALRLDQEIQKLNSAVGKAKEVYPDTAKQDFQKAEFLFRKIRKVFYTEQWRGHHWIIEVFWRGVWSLAKDIDAVIGFLQTAWLGKKVTRTAVQDWLVKKGWNGDPLQHRCMLQYQRELNKASRVINTAKEKVKYSYCESDSFSVIIPTIMVIAIISKS